MSWFRNESKPTAYNGVQFRSGLEADVARDLDRLGVRWQYESSVVNLTHGVRYLPDFVIITAAEYLQLPSVIEVKPNDLLYAVRDHLGCPERFEVPQTYVMSAAQMHAAGLDEIWKPKLMAEELGVDVLVAYQFNRHRSLSILVTKEGVELSKTQPAVNHQGWIREQERIRWQQEAEERRVQWEKDRRAQEEQYTAERDQRAAYWVRQFIVRGAGKRTAIAPDQCRAGCSRHFSADALRLFQAPSGRWAACCQDCYDIAYREGAR